MPILQAAILYFLAVFGTGFVLGIGRVLFLIPLLGERAAELLEMPVMLIVIVTAAQWVIRHNRLGERRSAMALSVGFIAMGLVLIADLAVGMLLRGMSVAEVFLHRDPVSGAAYYASLLLFSVMPAIMARRRQT